MEAVVDQMCCVACVLKNTDRGFDIMVAFLKHNYKTVDLIFNPNIKNLVDAIDPATQDKFVKGTMAFMASHGGSLPPLLHDGYYQKQELSVKYSFGEFEIQMGSVKKGQILELFMWDGNCDIGSSILDNLKDQCMETVMVPGTFKNLPNVSFDTFFSVDLKTGEIEVGRPQVGIKPIDKVKHGQWEGLSEFAKTLHFKRQFLKTPRISLMIVKGLSTSTGHCTSLKSWINFLLQNSKKSLEDMFVIFTVDYAAFSTNQVATKPDVRKLINVCNGPKINEKIIWIDTSSTDNDDLAVAAHGYHPEFGKKMDLNVRQFSDGCV